MEYKHENVKLFNADCMDIMKQYPDKYFDLAIPDPEYGINQGGHKNKTRGNKTKSKEYHCFDDSKIPDQEYFTELKRISKEQIIWGVNYFPYEMLIGGRIIWDKDNGKTHFSDCEIAYCSLFNSVRKIKFKWQGMLQENMKNKEIRIHPTQKPVGLYNLIWNKINADKKWKIIDTHGGSFSSIISSWKFGFKEIVGIEKDSFFF